MKILAFTDPHGDVAHARAIVKKAREENPSVIVCSGDFTLFGNNYKSFLDEIGKLGKPVYFVTGNHEGGNFRVSERFGFMKDIGFTTVDLGEIVLAGIPGSMEFWAGKKVDEEAVNIALSMLSNDLSKPMVLLTHFPPRGCGVDGISTGTPDAGGSATVRTIVEYLKPDLVITGHYHQDFGGRGATGFSSVINPGPEGEILELHSTAISGRRRAGCS